MSGKRIYEGQLRDELAKKGTHNKTLLRAFSNELFNHIQLALLREGHLRLHGFGSFKLKWTNERRGRNPHTGEALIIPAHPRIIFTPAKALKERINSETTVETSHTLPHADELPPAITEPVVCLPVNHAAETTLAEVRTSQTQSQIKKRTRRLPLALAAGIVAALMIPVYYSVINSHQDDSLLTATMLETSRERTNTPTTTAMQAPVMSGEFDNQTIQHESPVAPEIASMQNDNKYADSNAWFKQRRHKLKDGDSLWRLSDKNYTNPFYWPHIYQANRYKIRNPNKLLTGATINLPTLHGRPGQLTSEDKRRIAEGYFLVYQYHKKHNKPFPYYALLGANRFDPAVVAEHIYEIDEKDWESLQLASN